MKSKGFYKLTFRFYVVIDLCANFGLATAPLFFIYCVTHSYIRCDWFFDYIGLKYNIMFIEIETGNNVIQLINTDNIINIKCVGNNRPEIYLIDGTKFTTGTNKDTLLKLLTNK